MSNLLRLIGRRLVALPVMILGVTLLVFLVMSLSPADPARLALGESASQEALEAYRERNGLNEPLLHGGAKVAIWGQNPEKNAKAEAKLKAYGVEVLS